MCGVIAAVGPGALKAVDLGLLNMRHRGTRSTTLRFNHGAMAHVRLPIVGTGEENDQPIHRGRWTIGFVGELLDFKEIRSYAKCDAPVAAELWLKNRVQGFLERDGFWHLVAYDHVTGDLYGFVDYLAQKPLYVRIDRHGSGFASEPDALLEMGPVKPDEVYFASVVKWGYCPEPGRTPYRTIRALPPGAFMKLNKDGEITDYEQPDVLEPKALSMDDLRLEIERAVERRVTSADVPVAALVSGGLDSAITYTLAKRYGDVHAYHVENGEDVERRQVAPDATTLDCDDVTVEEALNYMQEPVDLGSLFPQVALSKAIASSSGERVCLTGDGADELFGGYGRAKRYDSQASDVWQELVAWHLPRLDRVMMRNRIEVRSPFLARRVAAAALALPYEARRNKDVLRHLFKDVLPESITYGEKRALRTYRVKNDREGHSQLLVETFRRG